MVIDKIAATSSRFRSVCGKDLDSKSFELLSVFHIQSRDDSDRQSKGVTIAYGGKWFKSPVNIKEVNKQAKIYVGRFFTLHNLCLCS